MVQKQLIEPSTFPNVIVGLFFPHWRHIFQTYVQQKRVGICFTDTNAEEVLLYFHFRCAKPSTVFKLVQEEYGVHVTTMWGDDRIEIANRHDLAQYKGIARVGSDEEFMRMQMGDRKPAVRQVKKHRNCDYPHPSAFL
eukprot:TRINITY_DN52555_c0_g1_i2.p1 TRINITY_DN52555_c0_g1~~TRINITY_DN52555_c0_g1_i2.p1  ORF type:complete len:138 (-),score=10.37 TRINITY_DN52555_c0_g1_i2:37-450(-)